MKKSGLPENDRVHGLRARGQAGFAASEVRVDEGLGRVTLNRILQWYAADFGGPAAAEVGLYPIVTSQYSSTTLHTRFHIQSLFF
jgi:hypothetical protein